MKVVCVEWNNQDREHNPEQQAGQQPAIDSPAISGFELMKRLCLMDSLLSRVMKVVG
jgi:hypothetical protein